MLGATCCARLATPLQYVATCCDMLGVVLSNLKLVKFFMQHLWMLHDADVFWPGSCVLHPGMRSSSIFNTQHVATRRNRVAKRVQHVVANNVAIRYAEMFRSFGRSLQMLGQQCRDMLCWYVAIVWPGLKHLLVKCDVFLGLTKSGNKVRMVAYEKLR